MNGRAPGPGLPDPSHFDPSVFDPSYFGDMVVADVMERWPATVRVFHHLGMACPGCVMAPFMTVAEAAEAYGRDPARLAEALSRANAVGGRRRRDDERA